MPEALDITCPCCEALLKVDPETGTVVWADVFIWGLGALQLLLVNPLGLSQFHLSKQLTSGLVASQMIGIGLGGLVVALPHRRQA